MKSKYEYFLRIDGTEIFLPVEVWKEKGSLFIKEKHFSPTFGARDESSLYSKLEEELHFAVMGLHIAGKLGTVFSEYQNSNTTETVQLIARDRKPWYKKLGLKCKKFFI